MSLISKVHEMNIDLWWSLHIIIATKQLLKQHHITLCMVGSVGLLYVGMMLEKKIVGS